MQNLNFVKINYDTPWHRQFTPKALNIIHASILGARRPVAPYTACFLAFENIFEISNSLDRVLFNEVGRYLHTKHCIWLSSQMFKVLKQYWCHGPWNFFRRYVLRLKSYRGYHRRFVCRYFFRLQRCSFVVRECKQRLWINAIFVDFGKLN